jgi:hypothetical protein
VDRLIFPLTIAQFPARAPLIEMIANLSPESITPSVIFIVHPTNSEG